jgi:hypothetical protein
VSVATLLEIEMFADTLRKLEACAAARKKEKK